jgi:hypothetical protein
MPTKNINACLSVPYLPHDGPPSFIMGGTSDRGTSSSGTPDTPLSLIDISDAPVGLPDPQYVQRKRKMLDAVNRLRAIG